jgi:glycosyltransferase involved in cell wall biosynthesis
MGADIPHISVCICTYQRPQFLARLLEELACQQTEGLFTYSIVVADNDQAQTAKDVVSRFRSRSSIETIYCVEPNQNIALARNRALAEAAGDFIAFIDDDEFPQRDWLFLLFKICSRFQAAGALGPVKPHFDVEPPEWIIRGGFFERPTHKTGFVIDWRQGRTGNLLFRRQIIAGISEVFRREFGSGGEDRNFFMRMIQKGCVFVWCNEAVVYEVVPAVRWKRSFMLRRALLRGKSSMNHPGFGLGKIGQSLVAVVLYSMVLPFLLISGQHNFMRYLIKLCDHAGRILAFLGIHPISDSYVTQ